VSQLTELRQQLQQKLDPLDPQANFKVTTGRTEFGEGAFEDQQVFIATVLLGEASPEAEERLDVLLEPAGSCSVKAALEEDRHLGGAAIDVRVANTSGARYFPNPGKAPDILGAEWKIEVLLEGAR
jgi:hypothetical protein